VKRAQDAERRNALGGRDHRVRQRRQATRRTAEKNTSREPTLAPYVKKWFKIRATHKFAATAGHTSTAPSIPPRRGPARRPSGGMLMAGRFGNSKMRPASGFSLTTCDESSFVRAMGAEFSLSAKSNRSFFLPQRRRRNQPPRRNHHVPLYSSRLKAPH
jgi:hypothetical protein